MNKPKVNYYVFLPVFLLLAGCIIFSVADNKTFVDLTVSLYYSILDQFGWLFLLTTVVMLIVCIWLYFSPFGETVIGGKKAVPLMDRWSWFTITLCTTIASGIVFWGAAEPVQHILNPPVSSGLAASSPQAAVFAMSTIYTHWTVLPYSIYTLTGLMFAFGYYNMKRKFSLGAAIAPLLKKEDNIWINSIIDIICVFALVAGLAASLGIGVLNISGGFSKLTGIEVNRGMWAVTIIIIVCMFMISSVSGIMKGVRILSNINTYFYIGMLLVILLFGGTVFILSFGMEGLGSFIDNFFSKALFTGAISNDPWAKDWPMFYFGNWMAWAPISAVFLGRIAYGRKVKEFIRMNLFATSAFSVVWFMIISGATVNMLFNHPGSGILEAYQMGYENVIYQLFQNLPLPAIMIPLYLFVVIISFVTASDSTTIAIAGVCSKGITLDSPESSQSLKIAWGVIIAALTWIMLSVGDGITGVKMLSNIGGLPALFFTIVVTVGAIKVGLHPGRYDKTSDEVEESIQHEITKDENNENSYQVNSSVGLLDEID
ncbi:MAG: BCCT family transporter [Eubacteriaceae bacterium]|nr:BCCT family transporter [Eubacteriaceae bacterium]